MEVQSRTRWEMWRMREVEFTPRGPQPTQLPNHSDPDTLSAAHQASRVKARHAAHPEAAGVRARAQEQMAIGATIKREC